MPEPQPLREMAAQHSCARLIDMLASQGLEAEAYLPFAEPASAASPRRLWRGAVVDSREASADALFVARKGAQADGHDYIAAACQLGCRGFLVSREWYLSQQNAGYPALRSLNQELDQQLDQQPGGSPQADSCFIAVPGSVEEALFAWARAYRQSLHQLLVVAVSGSYGKTSTKELLGSMLARRFCCQITAGNRNAPVGCALTIVGLSPQAEVAVLELGIDHPGEMDLLCSLAQPNLSLLTGVGSAHLGEFASRSELARQKAQIYSHLRGVTAGPFAQKEASWKQGLALLPADDAFLEVLRGELSPDTSAQLYSAELASERGYRVQDCGLKGLRFFYRRPVAEPQTKAQTQAQTPAESLSCDLPLRGLHTQQVFWAAEAAARAVGLEPAEILCGARHYQPLFGRSELLSCRLAKIPDRSVNLLQDCYNASPESLYALIQMLQDWRQQGWLPPCVLVLADMLELGQASREIHEKVAELLQELFLSANPVARQPQFAVLLYGGEMQQAWTKLWARLLHLRQEPDTVPQLQGEAFRCQHLSTEDSLAQVMQGELLRLSNLGDLENQGDLNAPDNEPPLLVLKGARGMHLEKIAQKILL